MADLSGQTFGRYQFIERMGRGGMADVYKAFQPGLDRFVAIKVLHPHLSEDPNFIERFIREAKAVAALQHPYIINVIDFETHDSPLGTHQFMVMAYIENGRTLKEMLIELHEQGRRLPMDQGLDITVKLADALAYAHQQGMVHRDIKPANVLLPAINQPLLSDFGIARILGQTGLTTSGAMIGTPAYMSPEQGKGEFADERSDIYALGIVLYEMLIGRPPYDADTPYGVIIKHINDPLEIPDNISLPDAVLRVVYTSLAKDPDERYQDAGAMRDALKNALKVVLDDTPAGTDTGPLIPRSDTTKPIPAGMDNEETIAVAEPAGATMSAGTKRGIPAWAYGVIGLLLVALIVGGLAVSGVLGGGEQEPQPETVGENGGEAAPGEEPGEASGGGEFPTIDNVDYGVYIAEALASGDVVLMTDVGDDTIVFLGDYERARDLYNAALEIDSTYADALGGRALTYVAHNEFEAAQADIEAALAIDDHNMPAHLAKAWIEQSWDQIYNPDGALESLNIAIELCAYNIGFCASAYGDRAQLNAWYVGDFDQAVADSSRAAELNPNPYQQAGYLASTGQLYFDRRDFPVAAEYFEAAWEASDNEMGYLRVAIAIRTYLGDLGTAEQHIATLMAIFPADPQLIADEGYLKLKRGDVDGALANAERALTIDPDTYSAYYLRGLALLEAGDPAGAFETFQTLEDREAWEYDFPFYTPEYEHNLFYDMARANVAAGDTDAALAYVERALEHDGWWPGPFVLRADIFTELGDLAQARENLVQALDIAREQGRDDWVTQIEERLDSLGT